MTGKNGCTLARRCAPFPAGMFALLLWKTVSFGQQSVPDSIATSPQPSPPESGYSPRPVDINTEPTLPAPESSGAGVQIDSRETGYSSAPRRFHYTLELGFQGGYDDNINLSSNNRQSDYFITIAPKVTLGFGDFAAQRENFLRLDFAPIWVSYVNHSGDDAIQELFRLAGHYRFSRLAVSLSQTVDWLDGAETETTITKDSVNNRLNLDVSRRTKRNIYTTNLDATYDLSDKNSVTVGGAYMASEYVNLISSQYVSGNVYINHQYSSKLVIGIGGSGGFELVDPPTPNQTLEQADVRLAYEPSGKFSLIGYGGVEFRQFENTGGGQYISPVFTLDATYRPFDGTDVTLNASRQTAASAVLVNQDFTYTSIFAGMHQRLFSRIRLGVSVGYENAQYINALTGANATRKDNYYFVEPSVDFALTRYWSWGAFYLRRQNNTSDASFSFYDNQIGLRTALKF